VLAEVSLAQQKDQERSAKESGADGEDDGDDGLGIDLLAWRRFDTEIPR
jgi:hypothetical protein